MKKKIASSFLVPICLLFVYNLSADPPPNQILYDPNTTLNTVTTAVPFLMIAPDSRAAGMGDAGVASTPDVNSMMWNPAKYAFIENDLGVSMSYSPWLRSLVNDMSLAYLAGYKKIGEDQVLAASLRFFSLGEITFTNMNGDVTGQAKPNEMAVDLAYSRKLAPNFSGGVALRFIRSNLTDGVFLAGSGLATHPGYSVATDISVYYRKKFNMGKGQDNALFAFGTNISNIGTKISYTENLDRDFIPINLRLGPSLTMNLDQYNTLAFEIDINKLLVPTPPLYKTGTDTILKGKNPNVSVVQGIFQSFTDAPGGTNEELKEFSYAAGIEYIYDKQFAIRGGYFYEYPTKGNRKYFTIGIGLKYSVFGIDLSYLIPQEQRNPLENTLRFTLILNFNALKNQPVNEPK
jgi:hypothetical protein